MKKIIFMLSLFLTFIIPVNAKTNDTTITFNNLKDYYYEIEGDGVYLSNYTTMFYANNKIAYCIEPGVDITSSTYDSNLSWNSTNFTKVQADYLELIGYFGYEYKGHNTTKYYLATQELIWEYMRKVNVKFTTAKNGMGTEINLDNEKNSILKLIDEYKKNPIFNEDTFSINLENNLKDQNNVLNNYEIIDSNLDVKIKDNSLVFKSNDTKDKKIILKYKKYDSNTTLIYTKGSSQKLATLRLSNDKIIEIDLKFISGKVEIQKFGEKLTLNDNSAYEMTSLPGVKFGLYDTYNNLIKEAITDKNGKVIIEGLNFGKYYLIELENKGNYKLDNKKYFFEISKNNLNEEISINNYLLKGKIEIIKKGSDGKLLNDVKFGIYDDTGKLICTRITKNGKITINDLAFGKYYLKELETPDGYLIDDNKHYFEINNEEKILTIELINDLVVDVPKTDKNDIPFVFLNFLLLLMLKRVS